MTSKCWIVAAAFLCLASFSSAEDKRAAPKPNIILIMADDLG